MNITKDLLGLLGLVIIVCVLGHFAFEDVVRPEIKKADERHRKEMQEDKQKREADRIMRQPLPIKGGIVYEI